MPSLVTSLLFPDGFFDPQTLVVQVLHAQPTATTYLLNCPDGTDSNDCGTYNVSVTLGPWASKTHSPGADITGAFDLFITDSWDPWKFSVHCEVSGTRGQECTTVNIGGNDDGHPTAVITSPEELDEDGFATFAYYPVTITSGLELLTSEVASLDASSVTGEVPTSEVESATATEWGGAESSGAGPETTAGSSSSASTPEATSGAASGFVRLVAVLGVAGLATVLLS